MSLDDLFNSNFFLTITISAVLISLLYLFVSNKLQEINGKMQTMFDIMRTLTNEVQTIKSGVPLPMERPEIKKQVNLGGNGLNPLDLFPDIMKNPNLIPIDEQSNSSYSGSEEEDDDDEEDDEEEDEDEDEGESVDDDEGEEDQSMGDDKSKEEKEQDIKNNNLIVEDISTNNYDDIKVLNISDIGTEVTNTIEDEYVKDLRKKKLPELKEILKNKDPNIDGSKLKKEQLIEEIVK